MDRCINDSEELKKELLKDKTAKNEAEIKKDLMVEREKCIKQIMEYNKKLDPRQLIKQIKKNKVNNVAIFNYKEAIDNSETALDEIIKLQKMFLKGYKILAERLSGKKEVLELLYEFRYYNLIPISKEELLKDNDELKADIESVQEFLIQKAMNEKLINSVNSNEYINNEILKNIFSLKIIKLENAEVNLRITQTGIRANYLDGDVEEKSKDIPISNNIGKFKIKRKEKNKNIFIGR